MVTKLIDNLKQNDGAQMSIPRRKGGPRVAPPK